jgi:DNA polymerase III epsilon subunit-like protein
MLYIVFSLIFCFWLFRPKKKKFRGIQTTPVVEKKTFDLEFVNSNDIKGKYLVFDIETTGLKPYNSNIVQLAWILLDKNLGLIESKNFIIKQDEEVPNEAFRIHGIDKAKSLEIGVEKSYAFDLFRQATNNCSYYVAHNIDFDYTFILHHIPLVKARRTICTMKIGTNYCQLYSPYKGYKWPKLNELAGILFYGTEKVEFAGLHDASIDVKLTAKCFIEMKKIRLIKL